MQLKLQDVNKNTYITIIKHSNKVIFVIFLYHLEYFIYFRLISLHFAYFYICKQMNIIIYNYI